MSNIIRGSVKPRCSYRILALPHHDAVTIKIFATDLIQIHSISLPPAVSIIMC
jgi:hypothetical protein